MSSEPARWKLQDAKAKFSELVRKAESEGPQIISRHGKDTVVLVRVDEFERRSKKKKKRESFVEFMRRSPLYGADLDLSSPPDYGRDIEL